MTCEVVPIPGGGTAIVCSSHRRQRCACGKPATRLCDWKVPTKKSGTCDKPLCASCTTSPTRGKDLCAKHVTAYADWQAQRVPELPLEPRA
ncbi:hypothetical protein [Sphingomonas sp. Ag1]|uniref:hypothetical protein n=1 Tax=Sphingomonas sp. Ag1 TaxID=1642949 RepID=UPI000621A53F|nr:hypothetical protein [Sphingomonas sp. Ag1]KKI17474.1 hypothetical protein XM50_14260 [Sphingomonas sp. Ag1]